MARVVTVVDLAVAEMEAAMAEAMVEAAREMAMALLPVGTEVTRVEATVEVDLAEAAKEVDLAEATEAQQEEGAHTEAQACTNNCDRRASHTPFASTDFC